MFGELIVCYLFLGGIGAGVCAVLGVMGLLVPADAMRFGGICATGVALTRGDLGHGERECAEGSFRIRRNASVRTSPAYMSLFAPTYACAILVLVLGMVCLLGDIGRIDRLLLLLLQPAPSYIAVGTYALTACVLIAAILSLFWGGILRSCPLWLLRLLGVLQILFAVLVMLYTGLMLSDMPSVPLWNTLWLPALFVASSLTCGMALVFAAAQLLGWGNVFVGVLRRLAVCDVLLTALELAIFVLFALTCVDMMGPAESATEIAAATSASHLLTGDLAPWLWGGFALCGVAMPLLLEVVSLRLKHWSPALTLVVSVLVLMGAFAMRYCLVQAGMHPSVL